MKKKKSGFRQNVAKTSNIGEKSPVADCIRITF